MKTANGKEIMIEYFGEVADLYTFLERHTEFEMVKYTFTFAYGYKLEYVEK